VRITTLSLKNYRVFADLELELPAGLVGVYGVNGAGKSSLLESITWALYGRARTSKNEIRTSGVSAECLVEIGFEHEGHHYRVRRSVTGVNSTVKARMFAGEEVVADGSTEVAKFVRSTLGMEESAFRSSVFTETKTALCV
jgi:DNA repair protein SbcC/Rad50